MSDEGDDEPAGEARDSQRRGLAVLLGLFLVAAAAPLGAWCLTAALAPPRALWSRFLHDSGPPTSTLVPLQALLLCAHVGPLLAAIVLRVPRCRGPWTGAVMSFVTGLCLTPFLLVAGLVAWSLLGGGSEAILAGLADLSPLGREWAGVQLFLSCALAACVWGALLRGRYARAEVERPDLVLCALVGLGWGALAGLVVWSAAR